MTIRWLARLFVGSQKREREQLRRFTTDVGRTHLMCALVEEQLHTMLRSFGYPPEEVPTWLAPGGQKQLAKTIEELKDKLEIGGEFVEFLHQYRKERNAFTHQLWSFPGAALEPGQEMEKLRLKVLTLHAHALTLVDILTPSIIRLYGARYQAAANWFDQERILLSAGAEKKS